MFRKLLVIMPFLLLALLALSGCSTWIQPVTVSGLAPTPVVSVENGGVDNPNVFADIASFQDALPRALTGRDTGNLRMWMSEPFLTGTWRADMSDTSPDDALSTLYTEQLGAQNHLALVENADLKALLGGKDPLSIPRAEAGVMYAFLVSGWGLDGRDEAVLFVARQADDSLKWHGWLRIPGGFSGARLGGIQPYQNEAYGYSLFLPKDIQVSQPDATEDLILAPGQGHPGQDRAAAFIFVEPADGRTAEQVVEALKAELGPGFNISTTAMGIDGVQALVVSGLPGQDSNRQLFMVHNDLLYHFTFVPDDPQLGDVYRQMEDIYAQVVNTFHFTR
jgi:hypothetical protein